MGLEYIQRQLEKQKKEFGLVEKEFNGSMNEKICIIFI
jgi:hypothetical protein